jgi:cell shape-determining protein MreC
MSESANNPVSAPRREPIQAIQGKPEGFSDDILKGIPGFEKLPPELQARAGEVLSKIERAYPDPAEAKNQKDKFRSGLGSSLDPKDMDSSAELISGELDVWNEKILNAKKDEIVAKKDEIKATSKINV